MVSCNNESSYSAILRDSDDGDGRGGSRRVSDGSHLLKNVSLPQSTPILPQALSLVMLSLMSGSKETHQPCSTRDKRLLSNLIVTAKERKMHRLDFIEKLEGISL